MMSAEPVISIIVPVYNTAERLPRTLDSLLNQTIPSFELILVNDGSTDRSTEICREYAKNNPEKIILLEGPNQGVSSARNRGLGAARGKWIYFSDSDDFIEPELCQYLLEQAENTNADLSSCAMICDNSRQKDIRTNIRTNGEEVLERDRIIREWIRPLLRLNHHAYAEAVGYLVLSLFRRDIIEKHRIRFIPDLAMAEDEAFYLEYLQYTNRAALSDKVLYHYLPLESSACSLFFKKDAISFTRLEQTWHLRWNHRLNIYRRHRLHEFFPHAGLILLLNTSYHKAQLICFSGKPLRERLKELRTAIAETKNAEEFHPREKNPFLTKNHRLFLHALRFGAAALFLFCRTAKFINEKKENKYL